MDKILKIEMPFGEIIEFLPLKSSPGSINVEIEDEWAGDSQTGFGISTDIVLNLEQLKQIRDYLDVFIAAHEEKDHG